MSLNENERGLSVGEQRADIHTSPTMPAGAVAIEMSTDQPTPSKTKQKVHPPSRLAYIDYIRLRPYTRVSARA